MRQIIRLEHEGRVFNLRVAGVLRHGDRVLLHQGECEPFWTMPGGRIELGEDAATTLRREMQEELGVEVQVGRLLWMVENFFKYIGKQFYELGLYFVMTLPEDSYLLRHEEPFYGDENGLKLTFRWFPIEELKSILVLPSFLSTGLAQLPENTQHLVHYDETG